MVYIYECKAMIVARRHRQNENKVSEWENTNVISLAVVHTMTLHMCAVCLLTCWRSSPSWLETSLCMMGCVHKCTAEYIKRDEAYIGPAVCQGRSETECIWFLVLRKHMRTRQQHHICVSYVRSRSHWSARPNAYIYIVVLIFVDEWDYFVLGHKCDNPVAHKQVSRQIPKSVRRNSLRISLGTVRPWSLHKLFPMRSLACI